MSYMNALMGLGQALGQNLQQKIDDNRARRLQEEADKRALEQQELMFQQQLGQLPRQQKVALPLKIAELDAIGKKNLEQEQELFNAMTPLELYRDTLLFNQRLKQTPIENELLRDEDRKNAEHKLDTEMYLYPKAEVLGDKKKQKELYWDTKRDEENRRRELREYEAKKVIDKNYTPDYEGVRPEFLQSLFTGNLIVPANKNEERFINAYTINQIRKDNLTQLNNANVVASLKSGNIPEAMTAATGNPNLIKVVENYIRPEFYRDLAEGRKTTPATKAEAKVSSEYRKIKSDEDKYTYLAGVRLQISENDREFKAYTQASDQAFKREMQDSDQNFRTDLLGMGQDFQRQTQASDQAFKREMQDSDQNFRTDLLGKGHQYDLAKMEFGNKLQEEILQLKNEIKRGNEKEKAEAKGVLVNATFKFVKEGDIDSAFQTAVASGDPNLVKYVDRFVRSDYTPDKLPVTDRETMLYKANEARNIYAQKAIDRASETQDRNQFSLIQAEVRNLYQTASAIDKQAIKLNNDKMLLEAEFENLSSGWFGLTDDQKKYKSAIQSIEAQLKELGARSDAIDAELKALSEPKIKYPIPPSNSSAKPNVGSNALGVIMNPFGN
jgi:hypothetical protein